MTSFLFHPKITSASLYAGLVSLAGFGPAIHDAFGVKGLLVEIALAVLLAVCAAGRSPVKAVDDNTPPDGGNVIPFKKVA